jgi:hypothetical protein
VVIPEHMRPSGCAMTRALARGITVSRAFRQLVNRISALGGIVYVLPGQVVQPESKRVLDGALLHRVTLAGPHRLLWVKVVPAAGDRAVITLAHELQHAVEVLESNASTERQIDALFERIGTPVGAWTSETFAAIEMERVVRRELSRSR